MNTVKTIISEFKVNLKKAIQKEMTSLLRVIGKKHNFSKIELYFPSSSSYNLICDNKNYKMQEVSELVELMQKHEVEIPKIQIEKITISQCLTCGSKNGFHVEYCQDVMDDNMEQKEDWQLSG